MPGFMKRAIKSARKIVHVVARQNAAVIRPQRCTEWMRCLIQTSTIKVVSNLTGDPTTGIALLRQRNRMSPAAAGGLARRRLQIAEQPDQFIAELCEHRRDVGAAGTFFILIEQRI